MRERNWNRDRPRIISEDDIKIVRDPKGWGTEGRKFPCNIAKLRLKTNVFIYQRVHFWAEILAPLLPMPPILRDFDLIQSPQKTTP